MEKIISITVSLFGASANSLSFSFFQFQARKGPTNRLFTLLSFCDFIACSRYPMLFWIDTHDHLNLIYKAVTYDTLFITMVITVTRAIKISAPLYRMKAKFIWLAISLFFVYAATVKASLNHQGTIYKSDDNILNNWQVANICEMTFWMMTLMMAVIISNIICVVKLLRPGLVPVSATNAEASKTVLILSVLFIFCNSIMGLVCVRNVKYVAQGSQARLIKGWDIQKGQFFFQLLIVLNSVFNPIVYFVRKPNMRVWVRGIPKSLKTQHFQLLKTFRRKLTRSRVHSENTPPAGLEL